MLACMCVGWFIISEWDCSDVGFLCYSCGAVASITTQTGTISRTGASRSDPLAVSTPPPAVRSPRASCGTQRFVPPIFNYGGGG